MIKITAVEGDVVHFEGTVTLVELDGLMNITGLEVDEDNTITHHVDQELYSAVPGSGAGRLLVYIYKKVRKLLCPECGNVN